MKRLFVSRNAFQFLRWLTLLGGMIVMLGQAAFADSSPLAQQNTDAARQMLELVNEWRLQEGLWPLKPNATLEAMALAQASYILPKIAQIPDEDEAAYHTDAAGQNPRERAASAPYNWPSYGQLQQMEVGENAAVGTFQSSMNFWKTSDIHRRAALSAVYREVGIAALPYEGGYFFLMDLGARPGVLTTLTDVSGSTLYLSNENSKYTGVTPGATQVRVFDADGRALTGTQPWTPTITFQERLSGPLFVLYTNTTYQALSEVSLGEDVAVLPGSAPSTVTVATNVPALAALPTKVPLTSPSTSLGVMSMATITPVVPAQAILQVTNVTRSEDLMVLYSPHVLVLYNNSPGSINLNGVSVGSANRLTVDRWQAVASFAADAFPSGSCLMVSVTASSPATPSSCKFVRSQLEVSPSRAFWTAGDFTVNMGESVLATCASGGSQCAVDLP